LPQRFIATGKGRRSQHLARREIGGRKIETMPVTGIRASLK